MLYKFRKFKVKILYKFIFVFLTQFDRDFSADLPPSCQTSLFSSFLLYLSIVQTYRFVRQRASLAPCLPVLLCFDPQFHHLNSFAMPNPPKSPVRVTLHCCCWCCSSSFWLPILFRWKFFSFSFFLFFFFCFKVCFLLSSAFLYISNLISKGYRISFSPSIAFFLSLVCCRCDAVCFACCCGYQKNYANDFIAAASTPSLSLSLSI